MRFAEFELLKYGRFEGNHLRFPQDRTDLQIVFGPNEAGKSTIMSAISDLLFGFPNVTSFDFRFDKQLLRVGAVLQADGVDFAFRRKKGRAGTLLDAQDQMLDEGVLTAMLAGYSAEGFQRMFSLDHTRLRDGGRAILEAKDDIGQTIFAAGSGLVSVAALLENLEAESKEIWTKRVGDRTYYAARHAYEEARTRQRAAQIKPGAWNDLRQELVRLDAELDDLRSRRAELEREREEVERRRRVLPHAALYRRTQDDLELLAEASDLPADAAEVLSQVATTLAAADAETALAEPERDQARMSLSVLVVDPVLIERGGEIEALRETKGAVDKSLSDLPRRRTDLATRLRRLSELQRELDWPEEPVLSVKGRLPPRVRLGEVRGLLEARSALDATLTNAEADAATARQTLQDLETHLGELPPALDLGELSAALKFARSQGDLDGAIRAAGHEVDRRAKALSLILAQLVPWTGTMDELCGLVLPNDNDAASALAETAQADSVLVDARRNHQAELDRKGALELQRTQLVRNDSAVSLEAIQAARENRDSLWREMRAHLINGRALPDADTAARDFERRSSVADALADRRYVAAEQSARLAALHEELERNALTLAQEAHHSADALAAVAAVAGTWQALLAPSGLQMGPKAFGSWSDRRGRALEAAEEVELAQAALRELQRRREDARDRIVSALTAVGALMAANQLFERVMHAAERLETTEIEGAQRRRDLNTQMLAAGDVLEQAEAKQLAAHRGLAQWEGRWASAVAAVGLSTDQSLTMVRAQLDFLEELRGDVDEFLSLQQRVDTMEGDIASFGKQVTALAAVCVLRTDGRPPAELLLELASAAREAAEAQTLHVVLTKQLAAAERQLAAAEATRARALARLRPLLEVAGTEDRANLAVAVQRSDKARRLRQELNRLAEEIVKAGAGPALETLLAESMNVETTVLAVRSNELQELVAGLSDEIAQRTGERATAQADFTRLDDGPDAAIAAADAEQARAEMAVQAEAYIRKRAEAVLLRRAITRYRAEKQTPLLKRASSLFSKLTLGRYHELLVELEADKARLGGLTQDQAVVPVEGMSEGTVDQLFLALRLAAVEDAVAAGAKLPFLADDLFINYDDDRASAGFRVLAELAQSTQVLFFTHHQHLVRIAEAALAPLNISTTALA